LIGWARFTRPRELFNNVRLNHGLFFIVLQDESYTTNFIMIFDTTDVLFCERIIIMNPRAKAKSQSEQLIEDKFNAIKHLRRDLLLRRIENMSLSDQDAVIKKRHDYYNEWKLHPNAIVEDKDIDHHDEHDETIVIQQPNRSADPIFFRKSTMGIVPTFVNL
jgi:hypothetical protein